MVLPLGTFAHAELAFLNAYVWQRTVLVCIVMGLMALPIPFEFIRSALLKPWPALLASIINMLAIPLMAWAAAATLSPYVGGGLIAAATIPCTLASAAVWTRRAGGDDSIPILVTLITNLTCVVITPLWLVGLLGKSIHIELLPLVKELMLVVVLPIVVAQLLRTHRTIATWSERHKSKLSTICQLGILWMVLLGSTQMGEHLNNVDASGNGTPSTSMWEILWTVFLTAAIHLLAMALGWYSAAQTGIPRKQRIGVAISGSQKTLMIGLKIALDCGVSIVPMVAFHVGQLLIDTLIADRWRKHSPPE